MKYHHWPTKYIIYILCTDVHKFKRNKNNNNTHNTYVVLHFVRFRSCSIYVIYYWTPLIKSYNNSNNNINNTL